MISGALAGIGGAIYAQSVSVNFALTTIVGPGFIALGGYDFWEMEPNQGHASSLFFELHKVWLLSGINCLCLKVSHPSTCKLRLYVLTMVVLAAFFGQAVAPKADGVNYIKSK